MSGCKVHVARKASVDTDRDEKTEFSKTNEAVKRRAVELKFD